MQWLSLILGASGLAFLGTLGKAIQWVYESRQNRGQKLYDQLESARNDAEGRVKACRIETDYAYELADYWRQGRALAEYEANRGGVTVTPMGPLPKRPTTEA